MNLKSKTALAVMALISSTAAFSQFKAPPPDYTITYNVAAVSDYRFRGITQTNGEPSLQGGVDFAHKNGIYLGAFFASNIKWVQQFNGANQGTYEVDLFGGYKTELFKGLGIDVGAITYQYPGNDSGVRGTPGAGLFSKADTLEYFAGLTMGNVSLKYFVSSGDFLGNLRSDGSTYIDLNAVFDLGNGLTLTPQYGYQTVKNVPAASYGGKANAADYATYSLTLAKDFGKGWAGSIAYVATDATDSRTTGFYRNTQAYGGNTNFIAGPTVVLGAKYSF
jgi:uncharacterized protein (TIGR02001 family)